MTTFVINPSHGKTVQLAIPGDKSISHRSIILSAIAKGQSTISGFLTGQDNLDTIKAFQAMGVNIKREGTNVSIQGVGLYGLKKPATTIDFGNSGTAIRLMGGLLAGQKFNTTLSGDHSLNQRPMQRIITPLSQMGAIIESSDGRPPLNIKGGQNLQAIDYQMPVASAQVKSAILLAAIYAKGKTTVRESEVSRNHTENMLKAFAYPVDINNNTIAITGGHTLTACHITVPGDISSAAFFMVAASIAKEANITLTGVNINKTRAGVVTILKQMGANINLKNQRQISGEWLADIVVKSAPLKGINIAKSLVPLAIDEFPALLIAASCAKGQTILSGAKELRVKESDRIASMATGLSQLGIDNRVLDDGIIINGGVFQAPQSSIDSFDDHRIAMAFAIAGFASNHTFHIKKTDNVQTSFPNFITLAKKAGLAIEAIND